MYLSSLQLAIAKGQTALQLWFERYDVSKGVTPIRTWLLPILIIQITKKS